MGARWGPLMMSIIRRRGAIAKRRGGDNFSAAVWDAIAPATSDIYVYCITPNVDYYVYQQIGRGNFLRVNLQTYPDAPGGSYGGNLPLTLKYVHSMIPMLKVDQSAAAWSFIGTGWTLLSGVRRSTTVGDYARFTTPPNTITVHLEHSYATNCGYAKVLIDGDPTAANLLRTAQEEVDAGRLVSTALVANGGTLNPTDRLYNCGVNSGVSRNVADDLPAAVHEVDFYVTGYKPNNTTDVRVTIRSASYFATGMNPMTASTILVEDKRLLSLKSAYEFAYMSRPVGVGTYTWAGGLHGYEELKSSSIVVDGSPVTMTAGEWLYCPNGVTFNRTTWIHHPSAAHYAEAEYSYVFDQIGLRTTAQHDFLTSMEIIAGYPAMLPIEDRRPFYTNGHLYESFARGSSDALAYDVPLDETLGSGEIMIPAGESDMMWMWSSRYITAGKLTNASNSLFGWAHSPEKNYLQDRGSSVTLNKAYWTMKMPDVGSVFVIPAGTSIPVDMAYRWAVVSDAQSLVGRGLAP